MRGRFLHSSHDAPREENIYANKSALILDWLLHKGLDREFFSIREVERELELSIGLIQKVFRILVNQGILTTTGIRTAKRFTLKQPKLLLENWLQNYDISKKCKMQTYRSAFQTRNEILSALGSSKVKLALHSAAEVYGCKNTNLETVELYVLEPALWQKLEKKLLLEPQERGYDVLLIKPYYKNFLLEKRFKVASSPLLTFLDLYSFPLRGLEQAEYLIRQLPELQRIYQL